MALVTPSGIYCANAGDSRTVMCENGKAVDLSKDHKPGNKDERKRIIKAGGKVIDGRVQGVISVSRSIGDFDYKLNEPPENAKKEWYLSNELVTVFPDITVSKLHKGIEFLILACDGVWDCKTSAQVIQYYKRQLPINGTSLGKIKLVNHNLLNDICPDTFEEIEEAEGLGSDNMTVVVVDFL